MRLFHVSLLENTYNRDFVFFPFILTLSGFSGFSRVVLAMNFTTNLTEIQQVVESVNEHIIEEKTESLSFFFVFLGLSICCVAMYASSIPKDETKAVFDLPCFFL